MFGASSELAGVMEFGFYCVRACDSCYHRKRRQELIRRWDSERELFYETSYM